MTTNQVYALSKKYTQDTAEEFGAVKGAPCTIQSIEPIENGQRITFAWTNSQGTTITDTMDVFNGPKGDQGVGIERIHQSGTTIIIYYTDGSSVPIDIPTVKGDPGYSPEITVAESTLTSYKLHIKTEDDEYDTPNLKGGGAGIDMEVDDEVLIFSETD